MSNSALSTVRGVVRTRLNESTATFWSNADLNKHIQTAYNTYFGMYLNKNPRLARQSADVTYTASAESVTVTTTGYSIGKIVLVEDRTDIQPGIPLEEADSMWNVINESVEPDSSDTPTGDPSKWYFVRSSSTATGVISLTQTLYLSPVPGSARSLRIHYMAEPQSLAGDTYTTGLPDIYEECVVSGACVLAKIQEQVAPGVLQIYRDQLQSAEAKVRENARGLSTGPGRIRYYDDTN
jgi:hypothetical protein